MRVTDPIFGQTRIPVYTNMLSAPVTNDLIEDESFDVLGYLGDKFGETIDLLRDNMVLNGTGNGQPTGILINPGGDATQPAVITLGNPITSPDGLLDMAFSLPEQYDKNASFVFSKTKMGPTLATLKDTNNRYLWGAGYEDSGVEGDKIHNRRIAGYPVVFSEFMPGLGADEYPILFGDLQGYTLVTRMGISVRVLNELEGLAAA